MSHLLQFFAWEHLRPELQPTSKLFAEAAHSLSVPALDALAQHLETLPRNPERDEAQHKLGRARTFILFATRDPVKPPPLPPGIPGDELKFNWWRNFEKSGEARARDLAIGLRFLLEAKDCAVRALLFRPVQESGA